MLLCRSCTLCVRLYLMVSKLPVFTGGGGGGGDELSLLLILLLRGLCGVFR